MIIDKVLQQEALTACCTSPCGKFIIIGDRKGCIYKCDAGTGKLLGCMFGNIGSIAQFVCLDTVVLAVGMDRYLRIFDLESRSWKFSLGVTSTVKSFIFLSMAKTVTGKLTSSPGPKTRGSVARVINGMRTGILRKRPFSGCENFLPYPPMKRRKRSTWKHMRTCSGAVRIRRGPNGSWPRPCDIVSAAPFACQYWRASRSVIK